MSVKRIIPRGDHEVYFIPWKNGLRKKEYRAYVEEHLDQKHPGFSETAVCDIQKIVLDKAAWYMATVMEQGTLTEYRILNPHGLFFTATGLIIRQPDFTGKEAHDFPGERIGYDRNKKEPFSLPVERTEKTDGDDAILPALLKKAAGGQSVFRKKRSAIPLIAACALVIPAALYLYTRGSDQTAVNTGEIEAPIEVSQKETIPGPFEMFANIARLLYTSGGVIAQWQYDQMRSPAFIISLEGIGPNTLPSLFDSLAYVSFDSISDIKYSGNTPQYTLNLAIDSSGFIPPSYGTMETQENIFPVLGRFHTELLSYHVLFLSEVLPAERNGFSGGDISISCPAGNFVPVMEKIENVLSLYQMGLTRMSLALNKSDNMFTFSYSFSPYGPDYYRERLFTFENHNDILAVFGYTGVKTEKKSPAANTGESELTKIGSIKDENGGDMMYYRDKAGKIVVK